MPYLFLDDCRQVLFPFIHESLTGNEQAPAYEQEQRGMQELEKVLTLVQQDEYYPTFYDKAAYLLCSIAGSQYFSNGNKRLGVVVLLGFLAINNATTFPAASEENRALLLRYFPLAHWEENSGIGDGHALFLYNLAILIGDKPRWGAGDFGLLKQSVKQLFQEMYRHGAS